MPQELGVLREQKSKGAGEGREAATRATLGVWPCMGGVSGAGTQGDVGSGWSVGSREEAGRPGGGHRPGGQGRWAAPHQVVETVWAETLRPGGKKDLESSKVCNFPAGRTVLRPRRWKEQKGALYQMDSDPPPNSWPPGTPKWDLTGNKGLCRFNYAEDLQMRSSRNKGGPRSKD